MAAKRRGNNEGSISKLPSGNWRALVTIDGRRISHTEPTRKAAQEWVKKVNGQIDAGMTFEAAATPFASYWQDWLGAMRQAVRPGTWENYQGFGKYFLPVLGRVKLKDIRPEMVQRVYNEVGENAGVHTARKLHAILHKCFGQAVKAGSIPRNPTDAAIVPALPDNEMKILTESQVSALLVAARGDRLEALYRLALVTGMREAELLGLRWEDLDWSGQSIRVQRQAIRKRRNETEYKTAAPKTRSGIRTISLGADTIDALRAHLERQTQERQVYLQKMDLGLVFPSSVGTPIISRNLLRSFDALLERAGLPHIRFHDLRHTATSLMIAQGHDIVTISRRLGHKDPSITLRIYGHLMQSGQRDVADRMDQVVGPIEIKLDR